MVQLEPARPLTVKRHSRALPLRVGTRASPLALWQTRDFLRRLTRFCPVLRGMDAFHEHAISTTGDQVQDRRLAEIGGKGLFAKEIHEALADGRIDFAVHSLKDLETALPDGIVLACTLAREDARDALVLGVDGAAADPREPYASLKHGALIGTSSVRRQAQMLHARPDLRIALIRGNVQSRLAKVRDDQYDATLLALAGLRRMELEHEASVVIDPDVMVPAAGARHRRHYRAGGRCRIARVAGGHRGPASARGGDPQSARCSRFWMVPARPRSAATPVSLTAC